MHVVICPALPCPAQPTPARIGQTTKPIASCCAEKQQFEGEMVRMIENHRSFPCIVQWVVFNEGWGQYEVCLFVAVHLSCSQSPCLLLTALKTKCGIYL